VLGSVLAHSSCPGRPRVAHALRLLVWLKVCVSVLGRCDSKRGHFAAGRVRLNVPILGRFDPPDFRIDSAVGQPTLSRTIGKSDISFLLRRLRRWPPIRPENRPVICISLPSHRRVFAASAVRRSRPKERAGEPFFVFVVYRPCRYGNCHFLLPSCAEVASKRLSRLRSTTRSSPRCKPLATAIGTSFFSARRTASAQVDFS
jgi:hypothetical protein